jgi:hypothetical protein
MVKELLDKLAKDPEFPLPALAREFEVSEAWLRLLLNSDGFKHQLAVRQNARTQTS